MRRPTLAAFFAFTLIFTACCSPASPALVSTVIPPGTNTAISFIQTETSLPPAPTAVSTKITETAPAIPSYMQPYIEGGYDKKSNADELYFVYDETSVHYLSGEGIVFNDRIIKSWVIIHYMENGEIKQGIVINLVIRGGDGLSKHYGKFVWASSMSQMGTNPSMTFMERNDNYFADSTPDTSYPIMHAHFSFHPTGDADLYEGIFPVVDGILQSVNIPGIGTVLPISNIKPLSIP